MIYSYLVAAIDFDKNMDHILYHIVIGITNALHVPPCLDATKSKTKYHLLLNS